MKKVSIGCFDTTNFKHAFSPQEDERLRRLVAIYGDKEWKLVAQKMPNRTTRQCRERYKSYLAPDIKNGPWTPEEDELLKQKYNEYGSKWSTIQAFFATRSDVNIKNRWTIISGKMNKEHKLKAYIVKSLDSSSIQFNQPKTKMIPPLSPSSPIIPSQVSPPSISVQLPSPSATIPIHNSFSDQNLIPKNQPQNISITHISTKPSSAESSIQALTSHPIQYVNANSCLPYYKKQNLTPNEETNDQTISSLISDKNQKGPESKIVHCKNRIPVVKKHVFPPISSLSIPSDDKLLIADRLFLPGESRIDESIIASGPNLTLANNFLHYGGNIW